MPAAGETASARPPPGDARPRRAAGRPREHGRGRRWTGRVHARRCPALHALGGNLAVGDRVSVLATFTSATGSATARVIARHLVVLAVGQPPTGIDQSSATVPVTVALPDPGVASELALANSVGKIDLLRDGGNTTAAIPAATIAGTGAAP